MIKKIKIKIAWMDPVWGVGMVYGLMNDVCQHQQP